MPEALSASRASRPFLVDVSRLIWRIWTRRLPTGIDRVCLAYLAHYGSRAQAVLQRGGRHFIFSAATSDRLFALLAAGSRASRTQLLLAVAAGVLSARRRAHRPGAFYFNVGHTGLNEPSLPAWVAGNKLRAIYLVHDLIPLTHPQFCRRQEAHRHERRMINVLASATGVINNSDATANSLAEFAADRELTLPAMVTAWLGGAAPSKAARADPPLDTPYFVAVGTIEGRKNHLMLLHTWRAMAGELGAAAPTLIVIGQRGWQAEATLAMLDDPAAFGGKVIELNDCQDEDLCRWIAGARALLMPTFAEGFGLPVLEALNLGTPVIASDLPIFREIGCGIPTLIDSNDHRLWASVIRRFVGDDPDRVRQRIALRKYRAPDWETHFAIVDAWLAALDRALDSDRESSLGFK